MIFLFLIGIVSFLFMYYVCEKLRTRRMRKLVSKIPSPPSYPFVGSVFEYGINSVDYWTNLLRLAVEHGTVFHAWFGPFLHIVLSDAKDIEAILNNTTHLHKAYPYKFFKSWLGWGLITSPPQKWKAQRKELTPAFHLKILETYVDVFNANVKIMMSLLEKEVGKERVDIAPFAYKCALDIICETAMATRIHAQLNEESQMTKSMKVVSNAALGRMFKPWLYPEVMFNMSPSGRQYFKNLNYINKFVDSIIAQRKHENEEEPDKNVTKKRLAFLDLLLMYAKDSEVQWTDQNIRDEVNTFMFAGHDTTASTIGMAIRLLAKHPEIQNKVLEEVNEVFGLRGEPTYQDLMNLKYTDLVIKETLRLYPVPYIGRRLHEDITLPSGHTLPEGAELVLFFYQLHRDPNTFPNPEKFNPDNFLPENIIGRIPYAYTPFSAGPRNCIGQKFAMLEMKATVATLIRSFKIIAVDPEPLLSAQLILRSENGIHIQLEHRI